MTDTTPPTTEQGRCAYPKCVLPFAHHGRHAAQDGTPPTTDTEPAERPEPTTKAGQDMESWLREPEDYAWGRRVTNAILAIEREAAERASGGSDEPHRDYAGRTCTTGLLHSHERASGGLDLPSGLLQEEAKAALSDALDWFGGLVSRHPHNNEFDAEALLDALGQRGFTLARLVTPQPGRPISNAATIPIKEVGTTPPTPGTEPAERLRTALAVYDAMPVHEITENTMRAAEGRIIEAARLVAAERASGGLDVERLARALVAHPDRLTWSTVIRLYPDWLAAEYARLATPQSGAAPRFDHDGTYRHHHDADTSDPVWWQHAERFGGEKREHRHTHLATPQPGEDEAVIEGYINPDGSGEGNWAERTHG